MIDFIDTNTNALQPAQMETENLKSERDGNADRALIFIKMEAVHDTLSGLKNPRGIDNGNRDSSLIYKSKFQFLSIKNSL